MVKDTRARTSREASGGVARANQIAEVAWRHHQAGRLAEAKAIYQQILRSNPRHGPCLQLLGMLCYQEGRPDLAIDHFTKAIAENPSLPVLHSHLGEAYRALGRFDEAIAACERALKVQRVMPDALNTLGAALYAEGRIDEAAKTLRRAIEFKPDLVEAHANLGNVLRAQRNYDAAAAAYERALRIQPGFTGALVGLGNTLQAQNRSDEAVACYRRALEANAKDPMAWTNLGIALRSLGRTDEAVESFQEAVRLRPDVAGALQNLGMALIVQGKVEEAVACYRKASTIKRGLPQAQSGPTAGRAVRERYDTFRLTAAHKLRHDIEQFEYLVAKRRLPASYASEIDAYKSVLAEIAATKPSSPVVPLTSAQRAKIGHTYNRLVYLADAPVMKNSSLNRDLDVAAIEDDYHRNAPGITFVDDFLTAEALDTLRRFCLESTIWYDFNYPGGYLGAYLSEGFSCELLFQIADGLRTTFPRIFGDHKLRQMWAYKYDSRMRGIPIHADAAVINVNFWITPDSANRNGEGGGLVVFKREAPLEWDFDKYNNDQESIRAFLADSESVTIPHRQNRAVIFNSNLFHQSDAIDFKEGYENRRINITILFGFREGAGAKEGPKVDTKLIESIGSVTR